MIQAETILKVADNSGAKIIKCFKLLGGTRKRFAQIGDIVVASVKSAESRGMVKKGDKVRAVIVRQRKEFRRKDGSYIRFDENAVVIVDKVKHEPIAGRVFGPIPREIAEKGFQTIASKAPEIV